MRLVHPFLLVIACSQGCTRGCAKGSAPDPTALGAVSDDLRPLDLGPGGAPSTALLDRLDGAKLELSPSNLEGDLNSGRYPLEDGWSEGPHDRLWQHASPVDVPRKRNTAPPSGMRLLAGSSELEYRYGLSYVGGSSRAWEIADDAIYVVSEDSPADWPLPPVLTHETSADAEARMNFQASGLDAAEFVRFQATIEDDTRLGLLLPAPSRATFEIELPPGAKLSFASAVAPSPVMDAEGTALLRVRVDGEIVHEARRSLGGPWTDVVVDLSRWAGQKVSLVFETEPEGATTRDYAVFASPRIVGAPSSVGPRRIVVVGLDTTRPDHLGTHGYTRATSPGMDRFASQALVFDHAYAPAPRTRPSFRTATTGRWPLRAITSPTTGEVLRTAGFVTGGVVANVHLTPKMGFADGFEYWRYENSASATTQVDRSLAFLEQHRDEDSFLFVHFMDPHLHYNAPEPYADQFVEGVDAGRLPDRFNRWVVYREMQRKALTDEQKAWIEGRYDGELAYLDAELFRFFTALDALPGRTLVVVHSDHGEEFWEHGAYEHNHSLYDELVKAILWIRPPGGWGGGPHRVDFPVSLADIAPTLYDVAGVKERPETDGTSLRPFLDQALQAERPKLEATLEARPIPIGHLMFDTERWAVVYDHHKYILHTMDGTEELFDLKKDPGETKNLASPKDLAVFRDELAAATGWPVGPGWRIILQHLAEPIVLTFEEDVVEAGVIDPEAGRTMRANLEWGEVPEQLPRDVAEVQVVGNEVRITPGPEPTGTVYVLGPGPRAGGTVTSSAGVSSPLRVGNVRAGDAFVRTAPGTLIVVRDTEAQALAEAHDSEAIDALKALGYVGE